MSDVFEHRHRRSSSSVGVLGKASAFEVPASAGQQSSNLQGLYPDSLKKSRSDVTIQPMDDQAAKESSEDVPSSLNRWSSSTASSITNNNRRHSSFSRRFSLSTPSFDASRFRALSPTKRRRSSDAQRDTSAIDDSSPASLPSLNRFSPLAMPNLSPSSFMDEQKTEKPLPARPAVAVEQPHTQHAWEVPPRQREVYSPSKRLREPSSRGPSHLSDIQEGSRATTPTPSNPGLTPSHEKKSVFSLASPRSGPSREASPLKHDRQKSRESEKSRSSGERSSSSRHGGKGSRDKARKNTLTRALRRANEAVRSDNEQDYVEAGNAYREACSLLDSVMSKTTNEHDRQKLTTIRGTYMTRISELGDLVQPRTNHNHQVSITPSLDQALDEELAAEEVAGEYEDYASSSAAPVHHGRQSSRRSHRSRSGSGILKKRRQDSWGQDSRLGAQSSAGGRAFGADPTTDQQNVVVSSRPNVGFLSIRQSAVPAPLSPGRPRGPSQEDHFPIDSPDDEVDATNRPESGVMNMKAANRLKHTSSWLDANDDRDSPPSPSSPARPSYEASQMKHISNSTEPGFASALDEAIEFAYGEYEPAEAAEEQAASRSPISDDPITRQALAYDQRVVSLNSMPKHIRDQYMLEVSDEEEGIGSDEEDRLLAQGERTGISGAPTTSTVDTHIPRESDSSGFSGHSARTWGSSAASSLNTTGTTLSTVDENSLLPAKDFQFQPPKVVAASSYPSSMSRESPSATLDEISSERNRSRSPNLRDRRLSAQKAQKLRIETGIDNTSPESRANEEAIKKPSQLPPPSPRSAVVRKPVKETRSNVAKPGHLGPAQLSSPYPSPLVHRFPSDVLTPPTPSTTTFSPQESLNQSPPRRSPNRSLNKTDQAGTMCFTSNEYTELPSHETSRISVDHGPSPATPGKWPVEEKDFHAIRIVALDRTQHALKNPPKTPLDADLDRFPAVKETQNSIFDSDAILMAKEQRSNRDPTNPKSLEPCPANENRRPFWYLRNVGSSLAHKKGAFLTDTVFFPNDAWHVRCSKLKSVDDKVANMDLLSAGLEALNGVDFMDADAVVSAFDNFQDHIMEQVQANLRKKLGTDVGAASVPAQTKDAPPTAAPAADAASTSFTEVPPIPSNTNSTGSRSSNKGYKATWNRLRNKGSTTDLTRQTAQAKTESNAQYQMPSVPYAPTQPLPSRISPPRSAHLNAMRESNSFKGPNANYCASLARLCDAAQVVGKSRQFPPAR